MMKRYSLIFPFIVLLLAGCKQEELLKELDQHQANEVIALLQHNNIQAVKREVTKEGFKVTVDIKDFAASVDLINSYGLPGQRRVEIAQMFPMDSLVSSPRAEKARLYSGLEQRLEQSLLSLHGVVSARVHVSYDLGTGEGERKKIPMHISSILNYDNSVVDATLLIGDVKRFLKNSFNDVDYDNISVVLSRTLEIQRLSPISLPVRTPSIMSWLFISVALFFAGLMLITLFIKRSNHPFASRLKKHTLLKGTDVRKRKGKVKESKFVPTSLDGGVKENVASGKKENNDES